MAEQITKILDIQVRYDAALEAITRYKDVIEKAKEQQKKLKQELDNGTLSQRQYAKEMEVNNQAILRSKERIQQLTKEVQNNVRQEKEKEGSLKQLRAALSNATAQYDALSRAERTSAKGKELQQHIAQITAELKTAEAETQRFYRNVGNYPKMNFGGMFGSLTNLVPGLSGVSSAMSSIASNAGGMSSAVSGAGSAIGVLGGVAAGATAVIAGLGAAFASGTKTAMDYNKAVSVLAAKQGMASKDMEDFKKQAEFLGATTASTASEVIQLQTALATLGFEKADILNMTAGAREGESGVRDFAQAMDAELGPAAELVGSSLRMFGATSEETGRYVDVLAKSCTSSAMDFHYLETAMSTVGPVANSFGFSIEDTLALLGQLANAGFDASSAATATRNILLNLADSNGKLAQSLGGPVTNLKQLTDGLQTLDANGISLAETLQLTDKRSVSAFNTFLKGADNVADLKGKLEGATGACKKMAKEMEDNLAGDVALLGSAWEGLMLKLQGTQDWQRAVVQWLAEVVGKMAKVAEKAGEMFGKIKYELTDLYNQSVVFRGNIQTIGFVFNATVDVIKGACRVLVDEFIALGKIIKGVFTLDLDTFTEGVNKVVSGIKDNTVSTLKEMWSDTKKAFSETIEGKVEITQTTKNETENANTNTSSDSSTKTTDVKTTTSGKSAKELEKEAKEREKVYQQEVQAMRKAEDEMLKLVKDGAEKQKQVTTQKYDRQIEDLRHKLETDKTLTTKSQEAINQTITALEQQKVKEIAKIDESISANAIKQRQEEIKLQLEAVKKGTQEEYTLRMEQMMNQKELDLQAIADKENVEELKLAITQKYQHKALELDQEQDRVERERELQAMYDRFEQEDLLLEQRQIERQMMLEEQGASDEQWELEKMFEDWENKKQILAEQEMELQSMKVSDYATREEYERAHQEKMNQIDASRLAVEQAQTKQELAAYESIKGGIAAMGEVNAGFAKAAKVIALAEIAINTGKAIAAGVAQAQSVPYPANLIAIATTVGTVMTNVATAISTVKSAKFAKGGVNIQGPGTGTSDSIDAKISTGESVMTAKATQMYGVLLQIMNDMANHPNYNAATTISRINAANLAEGDVDIQSSSTNSTDSHNASETTDKSIHSAKSVQIYEDLLKVVKNIADTQSNNTTAAELNNFARTDNNGSNVNISSSNADISNQDKVMSDNATLLYDYLSDIVSNKASQLSYSPNATSLSIDNVSTDSNISTASVISDVNSAKDLEKVANTQDAGSKISTSINADINADEGTVKATVIQMCGNLLQMMSDIANNSSYNTTTSLSKDTAESNVSMIEAVQLYDYLSGIVNNIAKQSSNNTVYAMATADGGVDTQNTIRSEVTKVKATQMYEDMLEIVSSMASNIPFNVAYAMTSFKNAKFAKGGIDIKGAGTSISDSINAKISTGESVMTAKATQMYGGLLSIMNNMANHPSYTLPTSYPTYQYGATTTEQQEAQNESLSMAMENIRPVVSVEEIRDVTDRVTAIETLNEF